MKRKKRKENLRKLIDAAVSKRKYFTQDLMPEKMKKILHSQKSKLKLQEKKIQPENETKILRSKNANLIKQIQRLENKISEIPKEDKRKKYKIYLDDLKKQQKNKSAELSKKALEVIHKMKDNADDYMKSNNLNPKKFLLDTNAVVDAINSFECTHNIMQLMEKYQPEYIITSEVKLESQREHVSGYSDQIIKSEMGGIFGTTLRFFKYMPEIDKLSFSLRKKYSDLSAVDARLLAFALENSATLITNDRSLKEACSREKVEFFDHRKETTSKHKKTSNLENWICGKLYRMGRYWNDFQVQKKSDKLVYDDKRNEFKLLLCNMLENNSLFSDLVNKIIFSNSDPMPRDAERFFEWMSKKTKPTLDDVEKAL